MTFQSFDTTLPVTVREVGLRDGLQILPRTMSTADKLQWLQGAYRAGLRDLEVGSFVPPKLMPQLADTAEIVAQALKLPGLTVSVLVPNLKGAERAIDSGAHAMLLPLSASHAHSLANLRRTPDEAVDEVARMRDLRDARGSHCAIEVGLSTAFGCTIQGRVEPAEVVRLVQAVLDAGVEAVSLADTVGYADPAMVSRLFEQVLRVAGDRLVCGHFHDTRGLGLANV
ncbi:MAG TPA: hydroxymethylglutaryl-CoA lyase, partial [Burkholderiaceae bacterium]|nr:hydroxymethylglutaryl-CoA lyase [Burkholderiaceae bacterium]